MTFDDDFVRLNLSVGPANFACVQVGLSWPPPERVIIDGKQVREATPEDDPAVILFMDRMSEITDDQRSQMTHVCRGAEYFYEALFR